MVLPKRGRYQRKGWTYDAPDAYTRRPFHGQACDGNMCSPTESQAARLCFVRALAAVPTKSDILPISKWLMRLCLDARMSNLFYWMYGLALPIHVARLFEYRSALFPKGNQLLLPEGYLFSRIIYTCGLFINSLFRTCNNVEAFFCYFRLVKRTGRVSTESILQRFYTFRRGALINMVLTTCQVSRTLRWAWPVIQLLCKTKFPPVGIVSELTEHKIAFTPREQGGRFRAEFRLRGGNSLHSNGAVVWTTVCVC